MRESI